MDTNVELISRQSNTHEKFLEENGPSYHAERFHWVLPDKSIGGKSIKSLNELLKRNIDKYNETYVHLAISGFLYQGDLQKRYSYLSMLRQAISTLKDVKECLSIWSL